MIRAGRVALPGKQERATGRLFTKRRRFGCGVLAFLRPHAAGTGTCRLNRSW
jgi:hypothetical protein